MKKGDLPYPVKDHTCRKGREMTRDQLEASCGMVTIHPHSRPSQRCFVRQHALDLRELIGKRGYACSFDPSR